MLEDIKILTDKLTNLVIFYEKYLDSCKNFLLSYLTQKCSCPVKPTNKGNETGNQEPKHKNGGPLAPFREIREGHKCLPTADALDPTTPSEAKVGCAEVRGRPARKQRKQQHRTE